MSNMSYCRFENTDNDLRDCINAIEERMNGDDNEKLSRSEQHALKRLILHATKLIELAADAAGVSVEEMMDEADDWLAEEAADEIANI